MGTVIDSDILKNNINYMETYRPKLWNKIQKYLDRLDYDLGKFRYIETREGEGTIEIKYNKKNIRLNSLYCPKKEAEIWAKQFNFNNINISVLMFGIANGVYCEAIMNNLKKDSTVILLEPDRELFLYCLRYFNMTRIISDRRIQIYIENINEEEFPSALKSSINAIMIPSMIVCSYPKFEDIYPVEAEKFKKIVKQKYELEVIVNFSLEENYKLGIKNTVHNLKFIKESNYSAEFIGKIPNKIPVIIVSAGPSLDKNIDELKTAYGKSIILATDTAVKYLEKHKVKYNAIVSIDIIKDEKNLNGVDCREYPIFIGQQSNYRILGLNKGRKIWMISSEFMCRLYKKHGLKYSAWSNGGSVATEAFNLAKEFGTKTIVLVGQDLAFSGESTHAGSITDIDKYEDVDIKYVDDIYGNKIKSRSDWVRYLNWFEDEIARLEDAIEVIDATEGGAKIQGTKIMKLSDVIDKYCKVKFDFNELVDKLPKTFSEQKYVAVANDLMNLRNELEEIENKAKYGLDLSDKMLSMLKAGKFNSAIEVYSNRQIKKINGLIEEKLVYSIIKDYVETIIKEIIKVNCFTGNEKEDMIQSYKLTRQAFVAIIEAARYAYELFDSNIKP